MYALLCTYSGDRTVDIREGDVNTFIDAHRPDPLDQVISEFIAYRYHADKPDGLIHTQSYVLLHSETASATPWAGNDYHRQVLRVYLLVMARRYSVAQGSPAPVSEGELIPTRLTFYVDGENIYSLQEYWTPDAEGDPNSFREEDVRAHFPEEVAEEALQPEKYRTQLVQACDAKAQTLLDSLTYDSGVSIALKHPEYYSLNAENGLTVCIYQMSAQTYSCVLLSGSRTTYIWEEILRKPSTTLDEMRQIVQSYGLDRSEITILPVTMPHSSYHYTIDDAYRARLEGLFWAQTYPQYTFTYPIMDKIVYDLDGDGMAEACTLGYGPTSGLFSFTFGAASTTDLDSDKPLSEAFVLSGHYTLSFELQKEKLVIRGDRTGTDSETVYFDIAVRDGHIYLQCKEEGIFFSATP